MSGSGYPSRDGAQDEKPAAPPAGRLLSAQNTHIPVVQSQLQTFHTIKANRSIAPATGAQLAPGGTITTAQIMNPNIIPKIPTVLDASSRSVVSGGAINLSTLPPQASIAGLSMATSQTIPSVTMTAVGGASSQPVTIPSVSSVPVPMASIIPRGPSQVPQVIQGASSQQIASSHSQLIAPHPAQGTIHPFHVPRGPAVAASTLAVPKAGGVATAVLRPAQPVSAHLPVSSSIQPRGPALMPVRPGTATPPPVSGPAQAIQASNLNITQDPHRTSVGAVAQVACGTVAVTIPQMARQVLPSTKAQNIPQPVLLASQQPKPVISKALAVSAQSMTSAAHTKGIGTPLNLQVTSQTAAVTIAAAIPATSAVSVNQPAIPIAKVQPQRQLLSHQGALVRDARDHNMAASGAVLQPVHRASPTASVPSSVPAVSHSTQAETRTQDRTSIPHMPYILHPDYASYISAINNNPYIYHPSFSSSTGTTIRSGIVPTQTPNLAATLQAAAVSGGRMNPMVVTVDPARHASVPVHSQCKQEPPGQPVTSSQVVPVTSVQGIQASAVHQGAPVSTSQVPSITNPAASPRPSILRKRPSEGVPLVKKSLASALSAMEAASPAAETASQVLTASPKPSLYDPSRENSQSSTDTATSAESTPPSAQTDIKIKQETGETMENGPSVGSLPGTPSSGIISNETSPRKKPRKQLLHANEELKDESSTDEEVEQYSARMDTKLCQSPPEPHKHFKLAIKPEELDEYTDEEGVKWVKERKRPNISLLNHYNCTWKIRNNHFLRYQDVKYKEERRPTVNELSNQKGVAQKASGWKLYHLAAQMEQMMDMEQDVFMKLQEIQDTVAPKGVAKCTMEDDIGMVHELSQGSIQRSRLLSDQLSEAKSSMIRLLEHKPRIMEIIQKHHSKRPVKKKERT